MLISGPEPTQSGVTRIAAVSGRDHASVSSPACGSAERVWAGADEGRPDTLSGYPLAGRPRELIGRDQLHHRLRGALGRARTRARRRRRGATSTDVMIGLAALFAITLAVIGTRPRRRPAPGRDRPNVGTHVGRLADPDDEPVTASGSSATGRIAGPASVVASFRSVSAAPPDPGESAGGAASASTSLVQSPVIYAGATVFSFTADYPTGVRYDDRAVCNTLPLPRFDIDGLSLTGQDVPRRPRPDETEPDDDGGLAGRRTATMMYFFAPDSTNKPARGGYALWRQVNDAAPVALVRNVLPDSVPFFRYRYRVSRGERPDTLADVPAVLLPITATDTAVRAITAPSIRVVQIRFLVTNGLAGAARRTQRVDLEAALPLARAPDAAACRGEPQLPPSLGA
jgi:hypothetical protein